MGQKNNGKQKNQIGATNPNADTRNADIVKKLSRRKGIFIRPNGRVPCGGWGLGAGGWGLGGWSKDGHQIGVEFCPDKGKMTEHMQRERPR